MQSIYYIKNKKNIKNVKQRNKRENDSAIKR